MGSIILIAKVLGVVIQKAVDVHNSGADKKVLDNIKDVVHKLHDVVHKHHAENCPAENAKLPHPNDLRYNGNGNSPLETQTLKES